jgi:uncharacterized protein YndB with AHSA1/START domain
MAKRVAIGCKVLVQMLSAGMIALTAGQAIAGVDDVGRNGFQVTEHVQISAPPDRVYAALIQPAKWWSSDHTFSHNAANLTLEAKAGGCWCETMPDGGSVQHMVVIFAEPGKALRLRGALGPMQGMAVDGALTFAVQADGATTNVQMTYAVGGYAKDGFSDLAAAVDHTLGIQLANLKQSIEAPVK